MPQRRIRKKIEEIIAKKPLLKGRASYVSALYFFPLWEILKHRIPEGERKKVKDAVRFTITILQDSRDFDENMRISKNRLLSYLETASQTKIDETTQNFFADFYAKMKEYPYNKISLMDIQILYTENFQEVLPFIEKIFELAAKTHSQNLHNMLKKFGISKKEYSALVGEIAKILKEMQNRINTEFKVLIENLRKLLQNDKEFKKQALFIWRHSTDKRVDLLRLFSRKLLEYFFDVVARHVKTRYEEIRRLNNLLFILFSAKLSTRPGNIKSICKFMARNARDESLRKSYKRLLKLIEKTPKKEINFIKTISEERRKEVEILMKYAALYAETLLKERLIYLFGSYGKAFYEEIAENPKTFYKNEILPMIRILET